MYFVLHFSTKIYLVKFSDVPEEVRTSSWTPLIPHRGTPPLECIGQQELTSPIVPGGLTYNTI